MAPTVNVRIPRRAVAGYAAGSVGTGGFGTLPGLVLAYYLTDTLAVPALLATLVVIVPKVWDVLIDPAVGALSDREAGHRHTRTRLMALGAVTLPVGFIGMFAAPDGLSPVLAGLWVLVFFVLATTSFSLFQVPYIALPAELTGDYRERTRLMAWRIAVLALAILLVGAGGPAVRDAAGGGAGGYLVMGVVIAALLLGGMLGTVLGVSPRIFRVVSSPRPGFFQGFRRSHGDTPARFAEYRAGLAALRDHPAYRVLLTAFVLQALATGVMLAAAQYVATYTLADEAALTFLFAALVGPALLVMPLWTRYAGRVGKPAAFTAASVLFAVAALAMVGLVWAPGAWVYLPVALAGVGYAGMQLFPLAMLPDVITAAGRERGGAMSGLWTAGETTGLALGPAVVLLLLAVGGFRSSTADEVLTQPDAARLLIVVAFSLLPAVLVGASLLVLRAYRDPVSSRPSAKVSP
ncbi:MFS transporter [Ornithinimicrobium sp. F0845]|uniref:MFS transporter n=1 Tax=Ornithinimicrobium sp. F0845 TaxID=2926412 RepID=UPI001FF56739|nr:MFS transporter [Ornithinimicrobium sp. F0845]MCK0112888.1 MFS transporter [Ornithinimicrobium sp. F0845]